MTDLNMVLDELKDVRYISPYGLGKLIGVRPQMVYNYIKAGYIQAGVGTTGKLRVTSTEARRFATKYLTKKNA